MRAVTVKGTLSCSRDETEVCRQSTQKMDKTSINLISAALRKIGCSNFSVELDNFQVSSKFMIMVVRVYVFKVRKIIL